MNTQPLNNIYHDSLIYYANKFVYTHPDIILTFKYDIFKCFYYGFDSCIIDRQNKLNYMSPLKVSTKYPYNLVTDNENFSNICDKQAEEIIKINKPTYVCVSGGVDSLLVLTSLLRVDYQWCKNNVYVIYNNDFVIESSETVLRTLKTFNLNLKYSNYTSIHDVLKTIKNSVILTGEMGDQLMGSLFCFLFEESQSLNVEDGLRFYIKNNPKLNKLNIKFNMSCLLEQAKQIVECSLIDITDFYDFMKWINFNFAFDYSCNKYLSKVSTNRIVHFFSTDALQYWALNNHLQIKQHKSCSDYKKIYKDYIFSYWKLNEIYDIRKIGSWGGDFSYIDKSRIIGVTDKNKFIYNNFQDILKLLKFVNK